MYESDASVAGNVHIGPNQFAQIFSMFGARSLAGLLCPDGNRQQPVPILERSGLVHHDAVAEAARRGPTRLFVSRIAGGHCPNAGATIPFMARLRPKQPHSSLRIVP